MATVAKSQQWKTKFTSRVYTSLCSPRYLIQRNLKEQALYSLASMRGDGSIEHQDVQMEFAAICQTISFEKKYVSTSYKALFTNGRDKNLRRLALGMGVQAFQQLTGANTFLYILNFV